MSVITIVKPKTGRERRLFLNFPWSLYKDDPYWIPPLRGVQKEGVGYVRNPFYIHNRVQTFYALREGKVAGRISAIVNQGHLDRYHDGVGFFGFFDVIDDQEVANALFDSATSWLCEQGLTTIRGPMNPSMNDTVGLLIEGFDSSPFFLMTYNPPYYQRLIENYGFQKSQDLYSFWGKIEMLPKVRERWLATSERIQERMNVKIRTVRPRQFQEDVRLFLDIYNRSLSNTWGFVPFSDEELKHYAASLKQLIVPELTLGAEIDGKLVGATFCLPDYNPRIKEIDGRLFPFGFIKLLSHKERIKKIRIISTNVLPEYQMTGLGLVLLNALVPKTIEFGIQEAEFSWVLESNQYSRGSLEKGGAIRNKTYRIFDKTIR